MQLVKLSKPEQEPFSLEDVKAHIRVDQNIEDSLLRTYLASAVDECSRYMQIAIAQQVYQASFDCWTETLWLPMSPVVSVDSVKYRLPDGTEDSLTTDDFAYTRYTAGALVTFTDGYDFPTLWTKPAGIIVEFLAGFDADDGSSGVDAAWLEMPPAIKQAVFLTVGHYYANREAVTQGKTPIPLPRGAEHLLDFYKVYR